MRKMEGCARRPAAGMSSSTRREATDQGGAGTAEGMRAGCRHGVRSRPAAAAADGPSPARNTEGASPPRGKRGERAANQGPPSGRPKPLGQNSLHPKGIIGWDRLRGGPHSQDTLRGGPWPQARDGRCRHCRPQPRDGKCQPRTTGRSPHIGEGAVLHHSANEIMWDGGS